MQLDPDTAMNPYSLAAARRAAGAGLLAVDEVMAGHAQNAFCAVRPCGHHATPSRVHGLLHLQQHRRGGRLCAREQRASTGWPSSISTCTTATAPRTCSARPQWRERVDDGEFFPASVLSRQRAPINPAPNMFNVPLAAGSDGAAARRALEGHMAAGARGIQAADDSDLRGIRCAPRGPAGRHGARRGRITRG